MDKKIDVSVILPVYNGAKTLDFCITSVIRQSIENLELIIVDDCSLDNSRTIANRYAKKDPRIKLIRLDKNSGGPALPRNKGIENAQGSTIAFIDCDDVWHPKKIEIQLALMNEHGLMLCAAKVQRFRREASVKFAPLRTQIGIRVIDFNGLLGKNVIPLSSVVVNRESLLSLNFPEDDSLVAIEDYALWLTLLRKNDAPAGIVQAALVGYRISPESLSSRKFEMLGKVWYLLSREDIVGDLSWLKRAKLIITYITVGLSQRLLKI